MKIKNKIKSAVATAVAFALTAPVAVLAQFDSSAGGGTGLPSGSITSIVKSIMNWILGLVGVLGVIGFAIAGILYLTAAGDETRIETAKKAMTWAIVGVIVALLGLVIVRAAAAMLEGNTTTF